MDERPVRLTRSLLRRALLVLKDLIGEQKGLIEPTYHPISRFELSFYRNQARERAWSCTRPSSLIERAALQVIHLFVEESMLCAVLYTRVKAGGAAPAQRIERADCLHELHFISRLLSNEFIYSPEGLEANAERTFQSLEADGVIVSEGTLVGLNPQERALGRENFDFFCFLLWPFIDTCECPQGQRPPRVQLISSSSVQF